MNKQQLAAKIWQSANKMRSKIEANEYKDYILGFIFYRFLSEQEEKYLLNNDLEQDDFAEYLIEGNEDVMKFCQENLGYFIAYDNLFSTWLAMGKDFSVDNVKVALSAFDRLISETHRKLFNKIFTTLDTGLSKLGESSGKQTKAINDLIQLIKDIPMDGKQDYDVLGFIYEYLISNFAANAGKKAGEFYTPHEVSQLMSEIVAHNLKGRNKIEIYDPTSGSGSLLITIGKSVAKYMSDQSSIKYYAQELKENTYNLTRMNLIMRGIDPANIEVRCGDTLEKDWPWFDESNPDTTYQMLPVDAVVSNPPYSQHWDPKNKEHEPRYQYGLAPKGKADYAFLLHDLYHIKPDGIMTIVLPHGVLFRGNGVGGPDGQGDGEGRIRHNLIENNHIEAIIGMPANIFFGTPIATIVMVLRQKRMDSDVLIVDASKCYTKEGKNNKLRASDIKRIVDVVSERKSIPKFSRLVSKREIRENGYNLNIPRYVDSSEDGETWDIYATMFGGIPNHEIDRLKKYWDEFPHLRETLFRAENAEYSALAMENVEQAIREHAEVKAFVTAHETAFSEFHAYLETKLIDQMEYLSIAKEEDSISDYIFEHIAETSLMDRYWAYQHLDDHWSVIAPDLEMIQTEGFETVTKVDPNMVIKKKDDKEEEVQDGWKGHIIPFELVQQTLLREQADEVKALEDRLAAIDAEYTEIIESMSEEEKDGEFLNEEKTSFVAAEFKKKLNEIYDDIESEELTGLYGYLDLLDEKAGKAQKMDYIAHHPEVNWSAMEGKDVYAKGKVTARIKELQAEYQFLEDSFEEQMVRVSQLMDEEKETKKTAKEKKAALHLLTKKTIEELNREQALELLKLKWITPLCEEIADMPMQVIEKFAQEVQAMRQKYAQTYLDVEAQIGETEKELAAMLDELTGNDFDLKGISAFKSLLMGE